MRQPTSIPAADGKLGILLPGMGAVATTFIAGTLLARRGLAPPVGSLTQLGTIRLGKRTENRVPRIRDFLPLATLDQLEFGGWDIFPDDAYASAKHAGVLSSEHLDAVRDGLERIVPMKGAFRPEYVRRLAGTHVKDGRTKADLVEQIRDDVSAFRARTGVARTVAVWCGSTEVSTPLGPAHESIDAFEAALAQDDPSITNSQLYGWALIRERVAIANGAPNCMVDFPAAITLARELGVPLAGKDFKTGQTLMKTIVAPGLKSRMLGIHGWFSTNILGNRDGEVLDDPGSFRSKEATKLGVLDHILEPERYPGLYGDLVPAREGR